MKIIEIQEHGTMLSDYFHGTSGVVLPLYIDNKTTKTEILDMLEDEIDMVWDHIEYTAKYHTFPVENLEYKIAEEVARIEDFVRESGQMNCITNPDLDFDFDTLEEDEETPVLIFTIEFMED